VCLFFQACLASAPCQDTDCADDSNVCNVSSDCGSGARCQSGRCAPCEGCFGYCEADEDCPGGVYVCNKTQRACLSSCVTENDCTEAAYCSSTGECRLTGIRALGSACSDDRDCASGACAGGICCTSACT